MTEARSPRTLSGQIALSLIGAILGTGPAVLSFWILEYDWGVSLLLLVLGVFAGVALTLPGVSGKRVLGATVGAIVEKNIPWAGESVYREIVGPSDDDPEPNSRTK